MNQVIAALFEGALLFQSGIPVRDMYDLIYEAYRDERDVRDLFEELRVDWDTSSSDHPLKMMGPFIKREAGNPDYASCRWFTELAASTSMVDTFWKSCGQAYILDKQIKFRSPDSLDMKLARELFSFFEPTHPLLVHLFANPNLKDWSVKAFQSGTETITFAEWVDARHLLTSTHPPLRCLEAIQEAAARMAYPELTAEMQTQWDIFSGALGHRPHDAGGDGGGDGTQSGL